MMLVVAMRKAYKIEYVKRENLLKLRQNSQKVFLSIL